MTIIQKCVLPLVCLAAISACSREKIADNTTDAIVFVGSTAVRGAIGAGKLVVRGAAAGAKRLQTPANGFPAGTVVCLDEAGEIYAAAQMNGDEAFCPAPVAPL